MDVSTLNDCERAQDEHPCETSPSQIPFRGLPPTLLMTLLVLRNEPSTPSFRFQRTLIAGDFCDRRSSESPP